LRRNVAELSRREYDLVIVGGGIYGVCAAWDATRRGLSVALIDRGDFGGATSANSLKIVHGGFRYIQHADLVRMRQSIRERRALMRIAPHLVSPIPFLIPTYGHGMQGKAILALALGLYNLVAFDRNRGIRDPERRIPWGEVVSRAECLRRFPVLERKGLTGAVVFSDAQMYSPPRLVLSYLRAAVRAGAEAANYARATGFLRDGDRVVGVRARDVLAREELEIRGRVVLNASGPWAPDVLAAVGARLRFPLALTKDLYLVVRRSPSRSYALAVPSADTDPDAIMSRGGRHFFVIPWRGHALIGSTHVIYEGPPDEFQVTDKDIHEIIRRVNEACPALNLAVDDVTLWNTGLVSFGSHYGKRSRVIDHAREHGLDGLITIIGVRYTTARGAAATAVDLVCQKLGRHAPRSLTDTTPIYGGAIESVDDLMREAVQRRPPPVNQTVMEALVRNYGSAYGEVLKHLGQDGSWAQTLGTSMVIGAEVIHAVREEMAHTLSDVVFRRTDLGTAGHPGDAALQACAALMASQLGWDQERVGTELEAVRRVFP
jgi:glycerol-3-phosphate dehydrogenase